MCMCIYAINIDRGRRGKVGSGEHGAGQGCVRRGGQERRGTRSGRGRRGAVQGQVRGPAGLRMAKAAQQQGGGEGAGGRAQGLREGAVRGNGLVEE